MNYLGDERILPRGTILICPRCRSKQAYLSADVDVNQTFDWRVIMPLNPDDVRGISSCCNIRYVTFEGLFHTEHGPY
jgi:hypothetical protein